MVIELSQTTSMPSITPLFTNDIEIKLTGINGAISTQIFEVNSNTQAICMPFTEDVQSIKLIQIIGLLT